jgi:hypothetical protein
MVKTAIFKMAAVAMETMSVCQNLWPHLYRKPPKGFPQNLAYILRRVGECNFHHYQSISHFKITLDINFHWNQRTLKFADFVGSHFETI